MTWKLHFERGIALFKQGKHPEALEQFNQALANGGETQFILYDSRAAVYENLNNAKDALRDAKTTIKHAPQRWQGYARAARLFMKTHKFDASLKMVDHALTHVKPEDRIRRTELSNQKQEIMDAQEAFTERSRRMQNHMTKLPVEIYGEIFQMVLAEDYARIITLLHVSVHWRQLIWQSPGLWHTLVLSKTRADKKASLWLERSRGRIRELHVLQDYTSKDFSGRPSFIDDMDWSHLRVYKIHSYEVLKHIDPHMMLCEIEHAEIKFGGPKIAFLHKSEKLKSLSIINTPLQLQSLQFFPSLTNLYLEYCYLVENVPADLTALLLAIPQLVSLHLEGLIPNPTPPDPDDVEKFGDLTVCKNLKTLEIIGTSWASFILLFDLPGLQTLRLDSVRHVNLEGHILALLSSQPPSLTEINLKNIAVHPTILLRMLDLIPTLEVLALVGMYDASNRIISTLVEGESEDGLPCLCPRLWHLDVSNCPDVQTSTPHALVKQRLALSAVEAGVDGEGGGESISVPAVRARKLEVLKMDGCPGVDATWLPWFREHVAEVSCVYVPTSKKGKRGIARRVNGL